MKIRNTRVYVVEDSPIIRNLLTELIDTAGATVIGHADTASAAIADITALRPDVVTIDLSLKCGSGFDVLEALAINNESKPLRIVLTNYTTNAHRAAALGLDAHYFFDKATQIREMLLVLTSVIDARSEKAA